MTLSHLIPSPNWPALRTREWETELSGLSMHDVLQILAATYYLRKHCAEEHSKDLKDTQLALRRVNSTVRGRL